MAKLSLSFSAVWIGLSQPVAAGVSPIVRQRRTESSDSKEHRLVRELDSSRGVGGVLQLLKGKSQ